MVEKFELSHKTNADSDCSARLFSDCGFDRQTLRAKPIAEMGEQGELLFHEYLPRFSPIDPKSPTYYYPSEVEPRKLIPGR